MAACKENEFLLQIRFLSSKLILAVVFLTLIGCTVARTVEETVEKTTKTVKNTSRTFTRTFKLSDEDLQRKVGIINFENNSLRETAEFQEIFHKGLPDYMNENCEGILVDDPDTGNLLTLVKEPPKLKSGHLDNYSLALIGRQIGLNAIVTGSLEDIRIMTNSSRHLANKLKAGEDREETFAVWRRLDLLRRDFTVNTLAVTLNKRRYGTLVDHFEGQKDIKEKVTGSVMLKKKDSSGLSLLMHGVNC